MWLRSDVTSFSISSGMSRFGSSFMSFRYSSKTSDPDSHTFQGYDLEHRRSHRCRRSTHDEGHNSSSTAKVDIATPVDKFVGESSSQSLRNQTGNI